MIKVVAGVIFFLGLALAPSGCTPTKATDNRRAELHLQLGSAYLSKGNYPAALHELNQANELDPNNPTVHNNLGLAYFVRQEFTKAESHFKSALAINSAYTDARNNLGRVYIEMGLYDQAINHLQTANKDLTYPYPDKTLTNLGLAYFNKGDFSNAREFLKKSLKVQRKNCLTHHYYGRTLFEQKDFQLAAQSFDQAIELCKGSKFDEPHYYSALSYYKLGDRPRATARFEELMTEFPEGKYYGKSQSMLKVLK